MLDEAISVDCYSPNTVDGFTSCCVHVPFRYVPLGNTDPCRRTITRHQDTKPSESAHGLSTRATSRAQWSVPFGVLPQATMTMRIAIAGGGGFAYILAREMAQNANAVLILSTTVSA